MRKQILAICDVEALYAANFMHYISQKKSVPFEIQAFTDTEKLAEAAMRETIEILLISQKAMDEKIRKLPVRQIMILSEGETGSMSGQTYPCVYKYQSSEAVIREVMACYGSTEGEPGSRGTIQKKPVEVYGIYSPLGRVSKTSFALVLGQLLAREKATLYLNLEEYSGFERLFQRSWDSNLSDLIYYVKQRQANLTARVGRMAETLNNLDYLPPVLSPADIRTAGIRDWDFLLDELELNSSYEVLILDLGDGVDEFYRILDRCDRVFMPVLSDNISQGKLAQFENLLRLWDAVPVLEKIIRVKPPYHSHQDFGEQFFEQLLWGEMGDYVREVIREELS